MSDITPPADNRVHSAEDNQHDVDEELDLKKKAADGELPPDEEDRIEHFS